VRPFTPNKMLAAFFWVVPLLQMCTSTSPVSQGGGGSEVEVIGYVYFSDDYPAPSTQVKLIPRDYDASQTGLHSDLMVDTSNSQGCYIFKGVAPGTYNVQAVQLSQRTRLLVTGVEVAGDTTTVPSTVLRKPGTLRILFPESAVYNSSIILTGTDIAVQVQKGSKNIVIDSVPVGTLPEIRYMVNDSETISRRNVVIVPSDTTTIVNPAWNNLQKIELNTSATGAGVTGDIEGFPVLIRLTADNFNFSQTNVSGNDLRFTTSRGALLPHEIELWDSAAGQAAVWVKVDTLYGNNSTQSITMFWGNPEATAVANSAAVFDTAEGFEGVWHLGEETGDSITDATPNRYNGVSPVNARPKVDNGVLGQGRYFDGSDDFITMPGTAGSSLDFAENDTFSVSAWVMLDTLDKMPHVIVAKGYYQYFLRCTYFPTDAPLWEFSEFNTANSWQACTTAAVAKKWSFLTGIRMGSRQFLYLNGSLVDNTPSNYESVTLSRNTSDDLTIGKFLDMVNISTGVNSYCYYKGTIDEVRISRGANSADWIRLCYMNQRTDDRLVVFK